VIGSLLGALGARGRTFLESLPERHNSASSGHGYQPMTRHTIHGEAGPYLTRYTLAVGRGEGPWALHVHRFHRGDADSAFHGHPWRWALSLMLAGGYVEYRPAHGRVSERGVFPGQINLLTGETLHRVDLLGAEAWTLFLTGPKGGSWAFVDPGAFVPWRDYLKARGLL
jgi:hypothetical protein